jgi:hypothetical protein
VVAVTEWKGSLEHSKADLVLRFNQMIPAVGMKPRQAAVSSATAVNHMFDPKALATNEQSWRRMAHKDASWNQMRANSPSVGAPASPLYQLLQLSRAARLRASRQAIRGWQGETAMERCGPKVGISRPRSQSMGHDGWPPQSAPRRP